MGSWDSFQHAGGSPLRLDEKGRIVLPARMRPEYSDGMALTIGQDDCVYIFTERQFEAFVEAMEQAPTDMDPRAFDRLFYFSTKIEVPDKQGRVTIPPHLRQHAGLDRDAVIVQMPKRTELWDAGKWDEYRLQHLGQYRGLRGIR